MEFETANVKQLKRIRNIVVEANNYSDVEALADAVELLLDYLIEREIGA